MPCIITGSSTIRHGYWKAEPLHVIGRRNINLYCPPQNPDLHHASDSESTDRAQVPICPPELQVRLQVRSES